MSAMIVLLETLSIRLERKIRYAKKEGKKNNYTRQRKQLNLIGLITYPTILLFVLSIGGLAYFGLINFNKDNETTRRATQTLEQTASSASNPTEQPVEAEETTITLNLTTWRPEDDAQIRKLIQAFDDDNPDITVVHQPIAGVNYDDVLTLQFNNKQGPDLFFIPPFNRKYSANVTDLSSLPIDRTV